ncbi:hypothetical protein OH492_15335 [Vibrio chagasii]|nr:hypothetical protein [Vibrio chagasii]
MITMPIIIPLAVLVK